MWAELTICIAKDVCMGGIHDRDIGPITGEISCNPTRFVFTSVIDNDRLPPEFLSILKHMLIDATQIL
jgi:hypothetical protein